MNAVGTVWTMIGIGLPFILAYYLLGAQRSYLLYLGIAFLALGASSIIREDLRWVPLVLVYAGFVMAALDGAREMRTRLDRWRREARDRELAFAELMQEMETIRSSAEKPTEPEAVVEVTAEAHSAPATVVPDELHDIHEPQEEP